MTDTERLDWCERHLYEVMPMAGEWDVSWIDKIGIQRMHSGKTLRDAIDEAIQSEETK